MTSKTLVRIVRSRAFPLLPLSLLTRLKTATEAHLTSTLPPEVIAQGTAIVEELLQAWASKSSASQGVDEGGDVAMRDEDELVKKEYETLQECFKEFEPRLKEAEWTRTVLEATY